MTSLRRRIRGGESARLEFKATCPDAGKLARVVASLANSAGGEVCIGVDDLGKIVGVEDVAAERAVVEEALASIEPSLETRLEHVVFELKDVLILTVSPLDFPDFCHVRKGGELTAYFRVKKETRPVSREVERMVIRLRRRARGDAAVPEEGWRLLDWLWEKGEKKEPVCAKKLNFSSRRLRKLAETLIGEGYLLPCRIGEGRSYVAIRRP